VRSYASPVKLAPGVQLGPYRILEPLGAGGMGEVYRARDTRLGRDVALKVLSEKLAARPDALGRFEREVRTIASLAHPNILALYDVGQDKDTVYAITELLEGESLDRRLARGSLPFREAVEIGAAIADGLAAAHARGVVHRDVKPANVFVTRDGVVKILDFGLATTGRAMERAGTVSVTAVGETEPGTVLGTVGYMAPEQARGEAADERSDIFALGCILYEMLSGRRAFSGGTPAETLAAILRDEPADLEDSSGRVPPNVEAVVRRCLAKDRQQRFQSARDLAFALRALASGSAAAVPTLPSGARERRRWRRHAAAGRLAILVLASTAALYFGSGGRWISAPAVQSVAVLPLVNRSGDPAQAVFVDGITDELIMALARVNGLRVTSRTSAMTYKGSPKTVHTIARELGVNTLVEGSVSRSGSRVTLTAALIDAASNEHLWSDRYERDVRDVLVLQHEIAAQVARTVAVQLSSDDHARLGSGRQVHPEAFDAYVRGRYYWNKRGPGDLDRAVQEFRHAIDVQPTYAAAYAGLSDAYGQIGYQSRVPPPEAFPKAKAAAQRAIELAPNLAEPHASLGFVHMYFDWEFAAAEREYTRAIALDPSSVTAHHGYSILLAALLRPDKARREIELARVLDPLSPLVITDAGFQMYYDRRYDEALAALQDAIASNPKATLAHFWLARTYQAQGRYDAAVAEYQAAGPAVSAWPPALAGIGHLYARMGRRADAFKVLADLDEIGAREYVTPYSRALVYLGLGDREQTLAWLERSYDERANWMVWLLKDPRWDPMRGNAKFEQIVERVGFPPESRARAPRPTT
jgi:eukaryotic-like serine/threonine-protein kinase